MTATRSNPTSRLARQHAAVAGPFRRGVTLVLVVMLLVLLQVAVVGTVTSSARQVDLMTVGYQGVQANYSAEGLLQRGIREAVRSTDEDGNGTIGTVGTATGSSLTRTTSGNDSILTGTVAVGDVVRSLQYRWTVTPAVAASGHPLIEFFTVATGPSNLAAIGWSGTPAATGSTADINFASINNTPMWRGGQTGRHGTRITGSLSITLPGTYIFNVESDDGSDFALNGSTLINNDGLHGMSGRSGTTVLAAGTYPFVARMFENGGGHGLRLYWQPPGATSLSLIPPSAFRGQGVARGVAAHTGVQLMEDARLIAWNRAGGATGTALATNAVTSNGSDVGVNLRDRASITGDVLVGVGATVSSVVSVGGSARLTGSTGVLNSAAALERVSMPVLPTATLGNVSLTSSTSRTYGPGTVRMTSFTMDDDSRVTVSGDTVLIVDGAVNLLKRAQVTLDAGAKLRLYVGGNVTLDDDAQLNASSGRSPDMILLMTGAATPQMKMQKRTQLSGMLLNPRGSVELDEDATFYGTMKSNTVTLKKRSVLYADVSASSAGSAAASVTLVYFSDLTLPN